MRQRYASFQPRSWRSYPPRFQLFRSATLNAAGWASVILVCLTGAGAGYVAGRMGDLPSGAGPAAGVLGCLALLVVADRRRWGRVETKLSLGDPESAARTAIALQRQGIPVRLDFDPSALRFLNRDARQIRQALATAGIVLDER